MIRPSLVACASVLALSACGRSNPSPPPMPTPKPAGQAAAATPPPAMLSQPVIDAATFTPEIDMSVDRTPALLRVQVLLDRARFSPGVIDGRMGENVRQALAAYQTSRNLPATGKIDEATFNALVQADVGSAMANYVITPQDVAGPFVPIPAEMKDQAALPALGFQSPSELLAETFHMTEALLKELNPNADLTKAGTSIVVAAVGNDELPKGSVASVKVDKGERAVLAYDASGKLIGFYPATIGSEERPAPAGNWKVKGVAFNPTYTYDPSRLTFKAKGSTGKLTIKPGPNNPVGAVWIDLTRDTYGIHGAPEPQEIGKTFSHGCVRLTNWDVKELATGVKPGVDVAFVDGTPAAG